MPGPEASVLGSECEAAAGIGAQWVESPLLWETHRSPRGSAVTSGVLSVTRQRTCKVDWSAGQRAVSEESEDKPGLSLI